MKVHVMQDKVQLGNEAAKFSAEIINENIAKKGKARIILSTGSSQFETINALTKQDVDWSKVEVFHLDEYIDLPDNHPASFRKYLMERFVNLIPSLYKVHFVQASGDIEKNLEALTKEIRKEPIDLGLIGIGENAHIAFNDPPANFDSKEAFNVVELEDNCKKQQVREGWFPTVADVPTHAITMTVHQIMLSNVIVSCVPHTVKAKAIKNVLENDVTNLIPATILKTHANFVLFLDANSASQADRALIDTFR
jgi:glucosamine-6-phosphate deaminase